MICILFDRVLLYEYPNFGMRLDSKDDLISCGLLGFSLASCVFEFVEL